MVKEKKRQLGEIEESLFNDIVAYVKEVNKHKPKGQKISRIGLIRDLIKELLADKVLTNDFITFEKPYYYNLKDLRINSEVTASTEFISEPEHQVKIEQIPNNLDSWSIEENTYCYNNNTEEHKGINITVLDSPSEELEVKYIVYKLKGNELKVGLVKPDFLIDLFDNPEDELYKDLKDIESEIKEDIEKAIPKNRIARIYNFKNNFKMLHYETSKNRLAKVPIWLRKIEIEYFSKINKILKEALSIGVETMPDNVLYEYNNKLELVNNDFIEKRTELFECIEKDTKEVGLDIIKDIEDNHTFEEFFSNFEGKDLKDTAKKYLKLYSKRLDFLTGMDCKPMTFMFSFLDNSEKSECEKILINIFSNYSSEEFSKYTEVMKGLIKELESLIYFGLEPEEDS